MLVKTKVDKFENFRDFIDVFNPTNESSNKYWKKEVELGCITDEEAIKLQLNTMVGFYDVVFIDDNRDGYFLIIEVLNLNNK